MKNLSFNINYYHHFFRFFDISLLQRNKWPQHTKKWCQHVFTLNLGYPVISYNDIGLFLLARWSWGSNWHHPSENTTFKEPNFISIKSKVVPNIFLLIKVLTEFCSQAIMAWRFVICLGARWFGNFIACIPSSKMEEKFFSDW